MAGHMREMLKPENVRIVQSVGDWREAVRLACRPLVDGGYVEARYPKAAIATAEKYGPYFLIAPDLALIHARPEQGVISKQIAVTVVRDGVRFSDDRDPVRLLVALAAEDSDSHIEVMRELVTLFCKAGAIEQIASEKTADGVYRRFVGDDDASE